MECGLTEGVGFGWMYRVRERQRLENFPSKVRIIDSRGSNPANGFHWVCIWSGFDWAGVPKRLTPFGRSIRPNLTISVHFEGGEERPRIRGRSIVFFSLRF